VKVEITNLTKEKRRTAGKMPALTEILRGTFIKCYLECIRPNCRCHKNKKYRHGPYYRVSYGKKNRMHHIYVPIHLKEMVQKWTENYEKIWQAIETISALNIKIIRKSSRK